MLHKLPEFSVLPYLGCVILGKLPDLSVLPDLNCLILGKLPDLSVLPHHNCMTFRKWSDLSVLPHVSCVILGNFADRSVVPLVICVILVACLTSAAFSSEQLDLRIVAWTLCASTSELRVLRQDADISVLPHVSCMILGKFPDLSVVTHTSYVILAKVSHFSVLLLLTYVIFGTLPDHYGLCDLKQLVWPLCASTLERCGLSQVFWSLCVCIWAVWSQASYLTCLILDKFHDFSVLPLLSCFIYGKLPELSDGFPVHHQLPSLAQTPVHVVGDAIQRTHPLSSLWPSAIKLSRHLGLFQWVSLFCIRWPKYWSFSSSISPSNEYSGLISFRMDWFPLLELQETIMSLLQYPSSKASFLQCSAFFTVQLSHPSMTTGKTIALTRQTFVSNVMSLLFHTVSRFIRAFLPGRRIF